MQTPPPPPPPAEGGVEEQKIYLDVACEAMDALFASRASRSDPVDVQTRYRRMMADTGIDAAEILVSMNPVSFRSQEMFCNAALEFFLEIGYCDQALEVSPTDDKDALLKSMQAAKKFFGIFGDLLPAFIRSGATTQEHIDKRIAHYQRISYDEYVTIVPEAVACAQCWVRLTGGQRKRCGKCKSEVYCGVECQQKAWPAHKLHCH
jgi:hypothetical protein